MVDGIFKEVDPRGPSVSSTCAGLRFPPPPPYLYACAVNDVTLGRTRHAHGSSEALELDVVIEIPRGSFIKRGSTGHVDFVSPLPCPFNYGSVPQYVGLEGDLLDAVVLGPRLSVGTRMLVKAWGAVILTDRGMTDHKLVCNQQPLSTHQQHMVLRFFHFYAACKGLLNLWRRRPGRNACDGWCSATEAIACAKPRHSTWQGPTVPF